MTIINPNSISGISSITALNSTAAINLFKSDGTAANIIAGVTTGANFKTGTSNVHSTGYECTNINASGIITATSLDISGDIDVDGLASFDDIVVSAASTFTGLVDINGGATVNGGLTSTLLTINGGSSPATINHTGGYALKLARGGKEISFNANYAASNTYANMSVTSGMDLRFTVGGRDGITIDGSNGFMGIDTNAPTAPLHIASNSASLKITRGGKDFSFNANYGSSNTYMLASITSGMDLRLNLGGADRIVFKSAGHIEPQTDSQINLGSNSVRFANVYADTLYGDGSNITGSTIRTNLTFDQSGGLDVTRTNANTAAMFRANGGAGTIGLYDTTNSKLLFLSNSNGDFNVQTSTNSYAKKLTVKQAGNVGIGTDTPAAKLSIMAVSYTHLTLPTSDLV